MSNKRRRSSKKKHDVPLTEDMLNELNKASMGHHGYMMHGGGSSGAAVAYDNYGQDPDEFYDMEDVWNNDKYHGQHRYKVNGEIFKPGFPSIFYIFRQMYKNRFRFILLAMCTEQ